MRIVLNFLRALCANMQGMVQAGVHEHPHAGGYGCVIVCILPPKNPSQKFTLGNFPFYQVTTTKMVYVLRNV